jgi:hypothetical protein
VNRALRAKHDRMSADKSDGARIEDPCFFGRAKKGAAMLNDLYIERNAAKRCGVCGRVTDLFELPGRIEKFCLECSADLAACFTWRNRARSNSLTGCEFDGIPTATP